MDLSRKSLRTHNSWLTKRYGGVVIFFCLFLGISFLTRLGLLARAAGDLSWDKTILEAFGWGGLFDFAAAGWVALPLILVLTLLPKYFFERMWARKGIYVLSIVTLYALLFGAAAEWLFWDELGTRFNFIAVDYLIYTTEVLGNIRESYPVPLILTSLLGASVLLFWLIWKTGLPRAWFEGEHEEAPRRYRKGIVWVTVVVATGLSVSSEWLPSFPNNFNRELAKNGLWSLFAAFRDNELDYDRFYETLPIEKTFASLRHELTEDGSVLLRPEELDSLHYVQHFEPEKHLNIVQITVESLSSEFLGAWNPDSKLTPNLDALAEKSLVFTRCYATGTRTDRGMEALSLSLPPTPGRSIIKRPHNENLFTLGSVLRDKGYDTAFIYGGFGYFDNMNYFFSQNGYRVIDRNTEKDVTFANVWGACDEDLYRWTIRDADASFASGRPFHSFVMTTSNHRPYTYPEGSIDLPPKVSGRSGAVKYSDYAIGKFLQEASLRPWFKNTVFVIVADHCASSAGKTELPVKNYHIPLIVYTPGGQIAPGRVETLMSQMDYAPTLLGLLNFTYPSRFLGHDVQRVEADDAHALIGNYQKLGHLEKDELIVLSPRHGESLYSCGPSESLKPANDSIEDARTEAVGFYHGASYLFRHGIYRELTPEDYESYMQRGKMLVAGKVLALTNGH